jgi:hypothetical protein
MLIVAPEDTFSGCKRPGMVGDLGGRMGGGEVSFIDSVQRRFQS